MRRPRTRTLATSLALLAAIPAVAAAEGEAPAPAAPATMAVGVSIGGVDVAGLTKSEARAKVLAQRVAPRLRPLLLTFGTRRFAIFPRSAGYSADVDYAVAGAFNFGRSRVVPAEGIDVPLRERVNRTRIRDLLEARAPRLEVPPRNARLTFRNGAPRVVKARMGREVNVVAAERAVAKVLLARRAKRVALPARRIRPQVTSVGTVIVIDRGSFRLRLYKGEKRVRTYPVAVGQAAFPTPKGLFRIIQKQRNPTWFPPSSPWARGLGPVPPGSGNPLGTRWMGTSAPAIGIHGTPAPGSIGTRASHGCIRMYIRDAEDLYERIDIGTSVLIR